MATFNVTVLGTGTSQGVPRIGCQCDTCTSTDPRDKRSRCSVYIQSPEASWVIDTGPDFRSQCLREGITKMDAALFTHAHTDHIMGFDDLRPFSYGRHRFPVYGSPETLSQLAQAFHFAFDEGARFPGYLHPDPREVSGPFDLMGTEVVPLPLPHGSTRCIGYLFKRGGRSLFAYLTDCKSVPEEVELLVRGVDYLVIDALREKPHPTHLSVSEALEVIERIKPGSAWLTHQCHEHRHADLEQRLPAGVRVAFDGLFLCSEC